jgi:hypothetical protein
MCVDWGNLLPFYPQFLLQMGMPLLFQGTPTGTDLCMQFHEPPYLLPTKPLSGVLPDGTYHCGEIGGIGVALLVKH